MAPAALAYLVILAACLVALAVALRPRRGSVPPPTPAAPPAVLPVDVVADLRVILTAAAALADRLDTAA